MRRAPYSRLPLGVALRLGRAAPSLALQQQTQQQAACRALHVSGTAGVQTVRGQAYCAPVACGFATAVGLRTAVRRCAEAAAGPGPGDSGSAARAQPQSDGNVDIVQRCTAVARKIAPTWQGDEGDLDKVKKLLAWSPSVERELSKANLRPSSGTDAKAAYEGACEGFFGVVDYAGTSELSVAQFGRRLARKFEYDPRPKTFLDAAVEKGKSKHLAQDVRVHVLATDLVKAEKALKRLVTSPTPALAQPALDISAKDLTTKVIVLHGPSGCGKTTAALDLAVKKKNKGACCMVLPDEPHVAMGGLTGAEHPDDRNKKVSDDLIARVQAMVPDGYRGESDGEDKQRPLVVVLDECGGQHHYVRGVIGHRDHIVTELERTVTGGNPVYLVVAGTGVEGVSQEPGSMRSNYALRLVQPAVWHHVREQLPTAVLKLLELDCHPDVQLALQMVRNARACVLFVNSFSEELLQRVVPPESEQPSKQLPYRYMTPIDVRIVRFAATAAAAEFVRLNGLGDLDRQGLMAWMLNAVAVQAVNKHATSDQDKLRILGVKRTYGLVADRAMVRKDADTLPSDLIITRLGDGSQQSTSDGQTAERLVLVLPEAYKGVRFEIDPGAMAVLQLVLGFGASDTSPDAFEVSTRDFLAFAVHASQAWFKPSPGWGELFPELPSHSEPATAPTSWRVKDEADSECHSRWRYPLELVTLLRRLRAGANQSDVSYDVLRYRASDEIVTVADLERVILLQSKTLGGANCADVAHVVVNRDKASAQDISVRMGRVVLKVQCKLAETQKLTERDVFKELHKMGNRDWRCVLAAWMSRAKEDRTPRTKSVVRKQPTQSQQNPVRGKPKAFVGAPSAADWQKLEKHATKLKAAAFLTAGKLGGFKDAVHHLDSKKTKHSADFNKLIALLTDLTSRRAAKAEAEARATPPDPPSTVHYALIVHGVPQSALVVDLPDDATVYAADRGETAAQPADAGEDDGDGEEAKHPTRGEEGVTARLLRGLYPVAMGGRSPAYGLSLGP